jgi:hypothetical protein
MAEEASLTFPLVLLSLSFAFTVYLNRQAINHALQACGDFLYRCIHNTEKKTRRMMRKLARRIRRCIARRRQTKESAGYELLDMSGNTATVLDAAELQYPTESESCSDSTYSTDSTDSTYSSLQDHIVLSSSGSNDSLEEEILGPTLRYSPQSSRMAPTRISSSGLVDRSVRIMPMEWEVEHARRMQQGGPSTWLHRVVDWTVERVQANFEAGNEISEFDRAAYINFHDEERTSYEHIE